MNQSRINDALCKCTRRELDYLYAERRAAIKACPDIGLRIAIREKIIPFPYSCKLEVLGRLGCGSLSARVVIRKKGSRDRYVRRLLVPNTLSLTSSREFGLRRTRASS